MVDIKWADLVGKKTIDDGGFVGDLMSISASHIDKALEDGRLTQGQAGEVYSSMIPSAFQTGMQYLLQEQLVEAQIDKAKNDAKASAISIILAERQVASLEKEIEVKSQQILGMVEDNKLKTQQIQSAKVDLIKSERQILNFEKDTQVKSQQIEGMVVDNKIKLKQLDKVASEIAVTERQVINLEKDIDSKSQSILVAKEDVLLKRQQVKSAKANVTKLDREIMTLEKDISLKETQNIGMVEDNKVKAQQVLKSKSDVNLANRQILKLEAEITEQLTDTGRKSKWSAKDLNVKDTEIAKNERQVLLYEKDIEVKEANKEEIDVRTRVTVAKAKDELAADVSTTTIACVTGDTTHKFNIDILESKAKQEKSNEEFVAAKTEAQKTDVFTKNASLEVDYGRVGKYVYAWDTNTNGVIESHVGTTSVADENAPYPEDNGDIKVVAGSVKVVLAESDTVRTTDLAKVKAGSADSTLPPSRFHAEMLKSRTEANIAIQTTKGYLGDAFYKQTKILQELIFSLANAGVITKTSADIEGGTYKNLVLAMESAMNGQVGIYGKEIEQDTVTPFINLNGNDLTITDKAVIDQILKIEADDDNDNTWTDANMTDFKTWLAAQAGTSHSTTPEIK